MVQFVEWKILDTVYETPSRYTDLQAVERSIYGVVGSAYDQICKRHVAVRKITKPFDSGDDAKRVYREIRLLNQLQHGNLISFSDIYISPAEDIYFITDLLVTDLDRLMKAKHLEPDLTRYIVYQILRGLKYIHSAGVVHGDLRPSKLLLNKDCDLKIYGFDLVGDQWPQTTDYHSTKCYRAPEIILAMRDYGGEVDIFSVGCIFAEMIQGGPLFYGKDFAHQLGLITELLGRPPEWMVDKCKNKYALDVLQSVPARNAQQLSSVFSHAEPEAIGILGKMLTLDPQERITADRALSHPYLKCYHDPLDEPVAGQQFDCTLDDMNAPEKTWRWMIYSEVLNHHSRNISGG
ncbi:MAPK protein hog1 [Aspergillus nanangensis]|uniref:MAPK protein hog1 n=1 Tax=Aspergillus nanangensis TaxID=2582783 RepID=A0AAD4CAK8_ASPNN|nr:MAPK protein hog1 [Aspergillus nanangensis]